jgi:hypothetical protein
MNPLDAHIDPATNHYQGLPTVGITMCNEKCPNSKDCRRHPDSGTVPNDHQSWAKFKVETCNAYWPVPHKKLEER